jgi:hypothetical protein
MRDYFLLPESDAMQVGKRRPKKKRRREMLLLCAKRSQK